MIQQLVAKLILKFLAFLLALYTAAPAGTTAHDAPKNDIVLVRIVLNEILNQEQNGAPMAAAPIKPATRDKTDLIPCPLLDRQGLPARQPSGD